MGQDVWWSGWDPGRQGRFAFHSLRIREHARDDKRLRQERLELRDGLGEAASLDGDLFHLTLTFLQLRCARLQNAGAFGVEVAQPGFVCQTA